MITISIIYDIFYMIAIKVILGLTFNFFAYDYIERKHIIIYIILNIIEFGAFLTLDIMTYFLILWLLAK